MLTFKRESWWNLRDKLFGIWQRHWEGVEKPEDRRRMPLEMDLVKYDRIAHQEGLHIIVARRNGEIEGYIFTIIDTHLHHRSTKCGFVDIYWINPESRGHWNGIKLFREAEKSLKLMGVKKLYGATKPWLDASAVFQRLEWQEEERSFSKWIA